MIQDKDSDSSSSSGSSDSSESSSSSSNCSTLDLNNNKEPIQKSETQILRETVASLSKILAENGADPKIIDKLNEEIQSLKETILTKNSKIEILSELVKNLRQENAQILSDNKFEKARSVTLQKTVETQKQIIEILKKGGNNLEQHVNFCQNRLKNDSSK